jgi:hypothetical protein
MSRTYHHSKHGKRNRWKIAPRPYGQTPGWWCRMMMNAPQRHRDRALLHKIEAGRVDADAATFSVGNRMPHVYFW